MGIFSRIGDVLKANINDMIDRAEDPEKMVKQIILDLQKEVSKATQALGKAMASERIAKRQYEDAVKTSSDWEMKAKAALNAGEVDLAKKALSNKVKADENVKQYQQMYEQISAQTAQLREQVEALKSKLDEAKSRQAMLIARSQMAKTQKNLAQSVGGMDALRTAPAIVIAEGYATAGSISDAIGHATVAAFDSGNLMAVATALKDKYPDKAVIIAGDDDLHLLNHPKVRANPGREKAEKAAQAVGGKAVFPVFAPGEREKDMAGFTDFNDLSQKSTLGMAAVARQLKPAIEKAIKEKAIELEKNKQLVHSHSEEMSR